MKRADWAKTESFHKSSRQLLIVYYDSYYFRCKNIKKDSFLQYFSRAIINFAAIITKKGLKL